MAPEGPSRQRVKCAFKLTGWRYGNGAAAESLLRACTGATLRGLINPMRDLVMRSYAGIRWASAMLDAGLLGSWLFFYPGHAFTPVTKGQGPGLVNVRLS